ncbi:MAG: hypothetical protein N2748_03710 [candidate division WOR-3 bacterium]|nr:hypothetical protein [candidate division WOR-3 bacterium]
MKKNLMFLFIGILIGLGVSIACGRFFKKQPKMFYTKEDITVKLNTRIHIVNRDAEKFFTKEIVIPKGVCVNDDGGCGELKFLKLSLVFKKTEISKYFNEEKIEGNYFINYGITALGNQPSTSFNSESEYE